MCTGARYHDAGSEYQQGKFVFKGEFRSPDESIGSPCDGDKGTPLMVKENERYILHIFPFHHNKLTLPMVVKSLSKLSQVHSGRSFQQM